MALAGILKQSTAVDLPLGPFLDETDGKTAETALTLTQPDIRLKKNAGNWAQKNAAQTLTHEENGYYEVALDTTDTGTLGLLSIAVHESGALPIRQDYLVVVASVYDLFFSRGLAMLGLLTYGTAQGGAAGNIQLAAATAFGDDIVNGATVSVTGATGAGQSRSIADYTGATDTATVDPNWSTNPDSTSEYSVFSVPPAQTTTPTPTNVTHNAGTAITATAGVQEVKVQSIANNAITASAINNDAITAAKIATGAIDADALAADAVDEIIDEVIEGSTTLRQLMRGFASALLGKANGLGTTTANIRDLADSKNRIVATVDADGNRSAVTLDLT